MRYPATLWPRGGRGRSLVMHTRFFSAIFGIGLAAAITPAHAADDIEAKAQLCAACHGAKGAPADPKTVPVIWGQEQSYLVKEMREFANGERTNNLDMPKFMQMLTERERNAIARYLSAL